MKLAKLSSCMLGSTMLLSGGLANAQFNTFFGEDLNPGSTVPAGGNAETARDNFLGALVAGVGNEDFESFANLTPLDFAGITLSFPGSSGAISATLKSYGFDSGGICDQTVGGTVGNIGCGADRFPTSGNKYLQNSADMVLTFSDPISAFGFYGTDIGDFSGQMTLTATNGVVKNIIIPHTVDAPSGALLFYGFTDTDNSYTSISFGNTAAGGDVFGFDDMVIGDLGQVITTVAIDIKPGSYPNAINVRSKGTISVAILTTDEFDASMVDASKVKFGDAQPVHYAIEDVDGDGDWDLILHFNTQDTGISCVDTAATLTGQTIDEPPIPIAGTDSVKPVGCNK